MTSQRIMRVAVWAYIALFFGYLFGPLILMSLTAFNSAAFPRVSPWECFTVEWFDVLRRDEKLMTGLRHSLLIGLGVVMVSVPIGLAGALMLTQVSQRVRPIYYTIVVSPILVPGVVLGISTLIFWDRLGIMFDASYESFFYDGTFLTIIGQSTFISAYSMLVFIARLQRFDPALEEAALDLGATHVQAFRKVLLPFLKPAIGSAAVLAFLASFENYNTTVFTIVSESTLTTVLASKVRYGINPSISALAVVIVVLTLIGAVAHEVYKRREQAAERAAGLEAAGAGVAAVRAARAGAIGNPAVAIMLVVFLAGLGTVYFAGTVGVGECKVQVAAEKRRLAQERIQALREKRKVQQQDKTQSESRPTPAGGAEARGSEGYRGIFDPGNLKGQAGAEDGPPDATGPRGAEGYRGIFDPGNLKGQAGGEDLEAETPATEGSKSYENLFNPGNLREQSGTGQ
jgi:spermidine/putrescine transport system permease protein